MKIAATPTLAVLLAAALSACGGSSSSTPTNPGGGGNPATPNLSLKGAITAQTPSTITVNGVTVSFSASTTTRIEKAERPESELKTGMVVKVKAHRNGAGREAEGLEIEFEDDVKGKVTGKTTVSGTANGTLTVGGQTVRVDDSTHFEDNVARLGSIGVDDRIRVSGVADDKGGLRATRVERSSDSTHEFEVKGVVSNLTAAGFTLTAVGGTVYSVTLAAGATIPAGVVDGGYVEVRSNLPLQAGNAIVAASISVEDRLPGLPDLEHEVEGIVTAGTAASFVINGTTVLTDASTRWDGGVPGDLVLGVKVEAEGVLAADGTLVADKVKFKDYIKLQGEPASLSVDASGYGTFTVNGVTVRTDNLTRQDDLVTSLQGGDFVELRGQLARDGASVVVTRFRTRNDDRPIIQGLVTAVSGDTLTILGKSVGITSAQLRNFRVSDAQDGAIMSKADFLAAIKPGETVVKARGSAPGAFADPALTAEEAELEGER
jgi:hypothetical protein